MIWIGPALKLAGAALAMWWLTKSRGDDNRSGTPSESSQTDDDASASVQTAQTGRGQCDEPAKGEYLADRIRAHAKERYVLPAREYEQEMVEIVVRDILLDMKLPFVQAAGVCSALSGRKFLDHNELELVETVGPRSRTGTSTAFTYRLSRPPAFGQERDSRTVAAEVLSVDQAEAVFEVVSCLLEEYAPVRRDRYALVDRIKRILASRCPVPDLVAPGNVRREMRYRADWIRAHATDHYVVPARERGEKTVAIRARDVLVGMDLPSVQAASVCSALSGKKFLEGNALALIETAGARSRTGPSTLFIYRLLPLSFGRKRSTVDAAAADDLHRMPIRSGQPLTIEHAGTVVGVVFEVLVDYAPELGERHDLIDRTQEVLARRCGAEVANAIVAPRNNRDTAVIDGSGQRIADLDKVQIAPRDHPNASEEIQSVGRDPAVPFVTYENYMNPHVTVHHYGCGHVKKHGGQHKYNQGQYKRHATLSDALSYAESTGLPDRLCSFCFPS